MEALSGLSAPERLASVVVVQDAFTSYYETPVLLDLLHPLIAAGVRPWLAPYRPNGKPLHVHGFLGRFERLAAGNATELDRLAATGVDLIGLDPSMTLTYRSEYAEALPSRDVPRVQLVQEWLAGRLDGVPRAGGRGTFWLAPLHRAHHVAPSWRLGLSILDAHGLDLTVLPSGCCGMAGTYGHEAEHRRCPAHLPTRLGEPRGRVGPHGPADGRRLLVPIASQARGRSPPAHPVSVLLDHARATAAAPRRSASLT